MKSYFVFSFFLPNLLVLYLVQTDENCSSFIEKNVQSGLSEFEMQALQRHVLLIDCMEPTALQDCEGVASVLPGHLDPLGGLGGYPKAMDKALIHTLICFVIDDIR